MRWWMILLLVLGVGWAIFFVPPHWFGPVNAVLWPVLGPVVIGFLQLFTLPGRWVLTHIWSGFFHVTAKDWIAGSAPWYWLVVSAFAWTFIVTFSYEVWNTVLPRFWKFIGRWDPFGGSAYSGRPRGLKLITGIADWWERETKFGQTATGGFASLLGVLSNEYQHGDIFLGRPKLIVGGMLRPIGIPTEKHFVTIASTGGYKSTGALVPNICTHPGNILIIDPKGELAMITARRRGQGGGGVKGMGDDVFVLDPYHIVPGFTSASYNVFDEMEKVAAYDADRPVSYARKVAQALVPSTSKDPYWDDAPRTFLTGLLLYIFQGPKEHRNLVRLRTLLMEGDAEMFSKISKPGDKGDPFDMLLVMMHNCPEGPYRHVITGSASSLSKMSPNQRGSVLTMAMEHTSFLDVPEIRKISMKSDFLLEDLKTRRISVYLCLPLNAVTGIEQRWLRMFVLLTVDMMTRVNKAPNPPLLLAIDEFPSLGKLDGIEVVAPTMRSQGVRLWVIGQDIEQFEKVYPDSWGSFIGGAEAVQFMGITHPPTVAWLAERLGQHVVIEQQDAGRGETRDVARERALRDADQIARMLAKDGKNQIIWRGSKRPLLLKVCPYFEYMPWWYYSRDRRFSEKWNRWIWRGGDGHVPPVTPPDRPPVPPDIPPPPPDPPDDPPFRPPDIPPAPPGKIPPLYGVPPGSLPGDNVPGTNKTWEEALLNYAGRVDEWAKKVDKKLDELQERGKPPDLMTVVAKKMPEAVPSLLKTGAMAELDGLIGLDLVKEQVHKTADMVNLGKERARKGMPDMGLSHHLVFTGNPGTGKTTVARIVGRAFKEMGLLKKGHVVEVQRADVIAGYVGQTALKMNEVLGRAIDGVLFIDEAYTLAVEPGSNDFAYEAVATLITAMENYRDRLVVIVAGYKEEMGKFIDSNPGLKSRFNTFIEFEDYSASDLFRIFVHMAAGAGIRLSLDAQTAASHLMESLDTGKKGFGNGRTVRNIFQECVGRQAARLSRRGGVDVTVFEDSDIPRVGEKVFS
jgi:stage V sporulation protein K